MAEAVFYLLDELNPQQTLAFVCQLVAKHHRQKQRIAVIAQSQQQAEELDELLWQLPADAFIPHNLSGEGPPGGAPVSLSWPESIHAPEGHRPCLINLSDTVPVHAGSSRLVIDFVPAEERTRALARERYKHYRQQGFTLSTRQAGMNTTD